jgi:hypothetical protein
MWEICGLKDVVAAVVGDTVAVRQIWVAVAVVLHQL